MNTTRRRVNPRSDYNQKKQWLANHRGGFANDRKRWTPKEDDLLLEGLFVRNLPMSSSDPDHASFQSELGRTRKAIKRRLWGLAVRYHGVKYHPGRRTNRSGKPLNNWEQAVIEEACGETGVANGAATAAHLGALLAREPNEFEAMLNQLVRELYRKQELVVRLAQPSIFDIVSKPDNKPVQAAKPLALTRGQLDVEAVRQLFKGMFKQMYEAL